MVFKTGRTRKITDTIELCDESGKVQREIVLNLDIDSIALQLNNKYSDYVNSTGRLKEIQEKGDKTQFGSLAAAYYDAVIDLFEMVFGKENTRIIIEFYNHRYLEMVQQLVPYIFKRILPEVRKAVKQQKKSIKTLFKSKI